ncbi:MAG: peroxiredoxin-like family protein [Planctomycetota bacterium]
MLKNSLGNPTAALMLAAGLAAGLAASVSMTGCEESGVTTTSTASDEADHDHDHDGEDHDHEDGDHEHGDDEAGDPEPAEPEADEPEEPADDEPAEPEPGDADDSESDEIGLGIGTSAPDATLFDAEGSEVALTSFYENGPVVVVFYRGGWCTYCNQSLAAWQSQIDSLTEAGGTLVAISPEKPDETATTQEKAAASFTILSDANFEAADGFKLRFRLEENTITAYRGYGIDLAEHNANGEWELPHSGTFVIDRDGVIRWASASEDYSVRPDPAEVIAFVAML